MGTIVLNAEGVTSSGSYDIVDGQQRLATFSVLFSVIRDRCTHYLREPSHEIYGSIGSDPENQKLASRAQKLAEERLLHVSELDHYYLELNSKDQVVFFE